MSAASVEQPFHDEEPVTLTTIADEIMERHQGNGRAFIVFPRLAPPGNSFWARLRLRVNAFPTAPDWAHWTLAEASGTGSPTLVRPLGGQYTPTEKGNFYGVGSDLGPTGDWTLPCHRLLRRRPAARSDRLHRPARRHVGPVRLPDVRPAQAGMAAVPGRPQPVVVRRPDGRHRGEFAAGGGLGGLNRRRNPTDRASQPYYRQVGSLISSHLYSIPVEPKLRFLVCMTITSEPEHTL